jgi:hypothetical protein
MLSVVGLVVLFYLIRIFAMCVASAVGHTTRRRSFE